MIKKNTKIVFIDGKNTDELIGGIPLTKGERIKVTKDGVTSEFEVSDKETEFIFMGDDQIANITYTLKKK